MNNLVVYTAILFMIAAYAISLTFICFRIVRHNNLLRTRNQRLVRMLETVGRRLERFQQDREADPLTRVLPRGTFEEKVVRQIEIAKRPLRSGEEPHKVTASVLFFDIDHFKHINDNLGHAAGDEVLRYVAAASHNAIREGDFICRWGGEEFVAVLWGASEDDAFKKAEEIREAISRLQIPFAGETLTTTASFGVAWQDFSNPGDFKKTIENADKAMYKAKEAGRDRVVRHSQLLDSSS